LIRIYANRDGKDSIRAQIHKLSYPACDLFFACPFFSYDNLLKEIAGLDRKIRLIVRLGPITHPESLSRAMELPNIEIRYFTSPKFHSKMYIFGSRNALISSANLTDSGVQRNNEVAVEIGSDEEDAFADILSIFNNYWISARVLNFERLKQYAAVWRSSSQPPNPLEAMVIAEFGSVEPSGGIAIDKPQEKIENAFAEEYRREFQEFLSAFNELKSIYMSFAARKQPLVPMRIEIDQFLSWLRGSHCVGEAYAAAPLLNLSQRNLKTTALIKEWFESDFPYLMEVIPGRMALIRENFSSITKIENLSIDAMFDTLAVCHAFNSRFRYAGGREGRKKTFLKENQISLIRKSVEYLLFGNDEFAQRMSSCIYSSEFKLHNFGKSCVQELYGWANNEDIPICNGRALKMLRFLGHDVKGI